MDLKKLKPSIRWYVRADLPQILAIDNDSFASPWSGGRFTDTMKSRSVITIVAEIDDRIVGYAVQETVGQRIRILRMAVNPYLRHRGIGRSLIDAMLNRLISQKRRRLCMAIRESNLNGQVFLRAVGFRCISIYPTYFEDPREDAYYMVRPRSTDLLSGAKRLVRFSGGEASNGV